MQLGQGMQLITMFYFSFNCITFLFFLLLAKQRSLSLPTCSWFSEESQWELVQRRFNSERVTPEEKSDERKSDASPMGPMGVKMEWGS